MPLAQAPRSRGNFLRASFRFLQTFWIRGPCGDLGKAMQIAQISQISSLFGLLFGYLILDLSLKIDQISQISHILFF